MSDNTVHDITSDDVPKPKRSFDKKKVLKIGGISLAAGAVLLLIDDKIRQIAGNGTTTEVVETPNKTKTTKKVED